MHYVYEYKSPIGDITMASDGTSLIGLWFNGQKYFASTLSSKYKYKLLPVFKETILWLNIYFNGKEPDFMPRIKLDGTAFRIEIWQILQQIPYATTLTYGDIAKKIATKRGIENMSAQAVGGAVGHNPISIIIPCHRLLGSNGSLTGYAGGIDKKIALLELEGIDTNKFIIPKKGTAL
ncbi:methylated-DNA--[protein]-cysteine S-methyltransferase [Thomasclavelia cocleata]|uniref:methylated-DNA--[protein]-cysteine S-methyltransferase n=1 Tax=Thomasclavelia cocleata TaxID=69824 RepID=UPI00242D63AA|nr:methylated-DNA--[protein]-cysteine S-methyltransferase [Thomasclavelia cocleata]